MYFWGIDDDIDNDQEAEVVYAQYDLELTILKKKVILNLQLSVGALTIGTEVFLVGHPMDLNFSYVVGEVA